MTPIVLKSRQETRASNIEGGYVREGFCGFMVLEPKKKRADIFSCECIYIYIYMNIHTVFCGCTHIIHLAACQLHMRIIRPWRNSH